MKICINEKDLIDFDIIDKYITIGIKEIIPTGVSSKKDRQKLLEQFGEKAFLVPDQFKFPIINPNTGNYDENLIYAALIRIKQYKNKKPEYNSILEKAESLYSQYNSGEKIKIEIISDGDSKYETDLYLFLDIFQQWE